MKGLVLKSLILLFFTVLGRNAYACGVSPSFTYSLSHTCGLPVIVTAANGSTGTGAQVAKYWWKVDHVLYGDTVTGQDTGIILLKKTGTRKLRLFVKDTAGCIDSSSVANISVSTSAPTVLDQNQNYSHSPVWMNCLQFISDPDTFSVDFSSADTLKGLKIFWGDGTADTSGNDVVPNSVKSHLYSGLGIFTIKIVTINGTCTDTVYGTVYNQRQPTAGVIGPPSGSNRGCVPHTLRIVNNSYNISDNTTFRVEWGNGDVLQLPHTSANDTLYHTYKKGICSGVIKITATNVCGSSFTTWNPIDISDRDKAMWNVTKTCDPSQDHVFHNLSSDLYCLMPDVKEYFWDFGDGTTVGWTNSKASQAHRFKEPGNYVITLIAKSGCGNDTFKDVLRVIYKPVAAFSLDNDRGCGPLSVTATDTSDGIDYSRTWTVREGANVYTTGDSILSYNFTTPGNHSISLRIANACDTSSVTRKVRVNGKPSASFAPIAGTCLPAQVTFTNTSTSWFQNPAYLWDFGDGTGSSAENPPAKVYDSAGIYTIRLIATDSCGSDTFEQSFTVFGLPMAEFSHDTATCTFDSVIFVNRSVNATQAVWSFGDSITYTAGGNDSVRHAYSVTGVFSIRLVAGTGAGCYDTAYSSIVIKPGAKAGFVPENSNACAPAVFRFTNTSVYGKDYYWYANNSLVYTGIQLPDTLIKTDSTVINYKLVVTSSSSCQSDTAEMTVFTSKNPLAAIHTPDTGCGTISTKLLNLSSDASSYFWNLGNGSISTLREPTAVYASANGKDTAYSITLIAYSWAGCADTSNTVQYVSPGPDAAFQASKSDGCGPLPITFTNQSVTGNGKSAATLTFSWNFGDGSGDSAPNPDHTFFNNGKKDTVFQVVLSVISEEGCRDTSAANLRIYPDPVAEFVPDKNQGCALLPVHFTNLSVPNDTGSIRMMQFEWNSGNGGSGTGRDFNAVYNAAEANDTNYTITLLAISEHGCTDTARMAVTVHPQPSADFELDTDNGCTPLRAATRNMSVSHDNTPLSYAWDFGNGYTSASENDSAIFVNNKSIQDTFGVSLIATNIYGCSDTAGKKVLVHPKPVTAFSMSAQKGCAPLSLVVTDLSDNAFTHSWGYGNVHRSGAATDRLILNGRALFDSLYIISHHVVSNEGCPGDTVYQQVLVTGTPVAGFEFSADSSCARQQINLINTSLGAWQYKWNFGDNKTSTQVNPRHTFPSLTDNGRDSSFKVSLEARSSAGCLDTIQKDILLVNRPTNVVELDKHSGCTDLEVRLTHTPGTYQTLQWDFGDKSPFAAEDTVYHTYLNESGNTTMYPRVALYRQRFNCRDTAYAYVLVYPKPVADFTAQRNDPCDEGNYVFINKSKFQTSNQWVIDEYNIASASSFSAVLPSSREKDTFYRVKLQISNDYGCTDSVDRIIKVKPKMQILFESSPLTSCENGVVDFVNRSSNAVRYFWTFGDGGLSNEVNPSYVYNRYGNYRVMLYGYDRDGCVDSSDGKTFIKVLERPRADFSFAPQMPKLPDATVSFTANPMIVSMNVNDLTYEWDFGDNSFPTVNKNEKNPRHTYTKSGNHEVTLTVSNQQCSDVARKPIFIEDPKPEVLFSSDTLEGCAALTVKFRNQTTNATSYRWIWGDGSPDSYEKEPEHTFRFSGTWDVTLIATGTGGTSSRTIPMMVRVFPKPTASFHSIRTSMNLPDATFNMVNTSSNAIRHQWNLYDTFMNVVDASSMRDPSFVISEAGSWSIRLVATNSFGCTDTMTRNSYLSTLSEGFVFVPNAFSPNKNGVNDRFSPSLYNVKENNYTFRIFNRWGEVVFETHDLAGEWDGTLGGELCPQDVYVWTVNGEYMNSDQFAFRGTVTLLR